MITAPFTIAQVDALNRYQRAGHVHPFTCANDHSGDRDLVATQDGLICPNCDYRQGWAHASMLRDLFGQSVTYEYAGFQYSVEDNGGRDVVLTPLPGQHSAAAKDKHIRAAREEYIGDVNARPAALRSKS